MPAYHEGWYQFTSAPLVTRGLVVLAGSIYDDMSKWMPSGVIRAFDAKTGRLVWNWDPGNPNSTAPIKPGQRYSWSSPNSWSTSTADEKLGMIYVPMGMGAVDQYGANRPATTEKFATSVVALDTATGKPRWVFQTVHHDLWDMDVPTQPALIDLPIAGRGMVPALVQSTKTGNIFVLDRRTGKPIFPVLEQKVPQGGMPGDRISPTQPLSTLTLLPPVVRERDMWGATMLDQLLCRIRFKQARYEGWYTPPTLKPTIVFPGNFGVMDWGGMAIDPVRKIAFAHPNYMAFVDQLTTRKAHAQNKGSEQGYNPNTGAPFGVYLNPFLSKLGLPCQAPPWGYVAGINLATGKVAWMHKNGTIEDESPLPLPIKMGVPSLGPPMITAAGIAFMTSTLDYYARAYDMRTGRELWKARLPAGAQAGPMSYLGRDGRQYVIVVAGGHGSLGTKLGLPCQAPPWGYVAGMDLATGKVMWKHKNGTIVDQSPVPLPFKLGVPSLGGPMTTAGGVAFMSSTLDDFVRAYDVTTGRQLWEDRLPAGGQATPMSYQGRDGRQYVVVVAGGHGTLGTKAGDDVIAYALPQRG